MLNEQLFTSHGPRLAAGPSVAESNGDTRGQDVFRYTESSPPVPETTIDGALLKASMDALPDGVVLLDAERRILYLNAAARRLARGAEGTTADRPGTVFPLELAASLDEALAGAARAGAAGATLERFIAPLACWLELRAFSTPTGWTILLREMTNRASVDASAGGAEQWDGHRHAEQELELLRAIALEIGAADDLETALVQALETVCRATGWVTGEAWLPDEEAGLLMRGAVWEGEQEGLDEFHTASRNFFFAPGEGLPGRVWEVKAATWIRDVQQDVCYVRADLARRLGLHAAVGIPVLAGETVAAVIVFYHSEPRREDARLVQMVSAVASQLGTLVQRKRAEDALVRQAEALARSNEELERFAYVASHDLQEPLRMVSSYTQLLARRYSDRLDGDALEFIDYAVEGVTRMQALINDLLTFSRIATHGGPFLPTESEAVLERTLQQLTLRLEETGAVITHDPLPLVVADAVQLGQVFENLITNAIKFRGAEPPHIHISARRDAAGWTFTIRDNGIGIESQYFERIFVLFQRLHPRAEYPGTGIGLAICKKVVERHGGRMWVESTAGQGSAFSFFLPDRK